MRTKTKCNNLAGDTAKRSNLKGIKSKNFDKMHVCIIELRPRRRQKNRIKSFEYFGKFQRCQNVRNRAFHGKFLCEPEFR